LLEYKIKFQPFVAFRPAETIKGISMHLHSLEGRFSFQFSKTKVQGRSGVVVYIYNLNTQEAEAGRFQDQG
jgi:hypothetical protein